MFSMNRRSLQLMICVCILGLYVSWMVGRYFYDVMSIHTEKRTNSLKIFTSHIQMGFVLLKHKEFEILEDRLREAKNRDEIMSYELKNGEDVEFTLDRSGVIATLPPSPNLQLWHAKTYAFARVVNGPYTLTLVTHDSLQEYIAEHITNMIPVLLRDLAIVMLATAWILIYFLKDIVTALKALSSRKGSKVANVAPRSAEGVVLMRGLNAMESSIDQLQAQNQVLNNQVLSALKTELSSGRKPPYEFECTLVRVDVNNFSYIFNHYPIEDFMGVINEFFEKVTELVSRYNGYVYEFVGDEVIFYFKDSDHQNSALTAISALRDISDLAVQLDEKVKPQLGYNFRVKCSAAHGKLRFGPQVNGYSLAGSILIDTVRILSLIHEKEVNSIFYPRDLHEMARPLVKSKPQTQAVLKGSSHALEIWSYEHHQELGEILEAVTPETVSALSFYRSNEHIRSVLKHLRENARMLDPKVFIAVATQMRQVRIAKASHEVVSEYRLLIKEMIRHCIGTVSHVDDEFRLSITISLAAHLLDQNSFEAELKPFFNDCLKLKNRRVVANALDVFSHFDAIDDSDTIRSLLDHKDNRVVANALIREGMKALNKPVIKHLSKMLKSKDPSFHASALYVVGELAAHHRHANAVYYETNIAFHRLFSEIETSIRNPNGMIRRQALIAGRKVNDKKLTTIIMAHYNSERDPALRDEVENLFLDQPIDQKAAA